MLVAQCAAPCAMAAAPAAANGGVEAAAVGQLQEVVISAQKRSENLQDVPISAQVIGSAELSDSNTSNFGDLMQTVPAVTVTTRSFGNTITIRGIGDTGGSINMDTAVSTFVDDIYEGRSRQTVVPFFDVERIEILKGPQSTFFGNNAIAGALSVITRKPGEQFDASGRVLYGMHGKYAAEAGATLPVGERSSLRLAGLWSGGRGWIRNIYTGDHAPELRDMGARLTGRLRMTDDFEAMLKVEWNDHRTLGTGLSMPTQIVNCPPPAPLRVNSISRDCPQVIALGLPMGVENNVNTGLDGQGNWNTNLKSVLNLDYQRGGHSFASVTGYSGYEFETRLDASVFNVWTLTQNLFEDYSQWSQEFRVTSPTDQPVTYLFGTYYQTDQLDIPTFVRNAPFLRANYLAAGIPEQYLPGSLNTPFEQEQQIYSVFGALSWSLTDALTLNAGLRQSWVKKDVLTSTRYGTAGALYGGFTPIPSQIEQLFTFQLGPPGTLAIEISNKDLMPSMSLEYRFDSDIMAYASFANGFKSGGVTPGSFTGFPPEFGPEFVDAFEVGIKSKWFADTLQVNLAVFRSEYKDLQVTARQANPETNTYQTTTANAAEAISQGFEFESEWLITRGLRFTLKGTYLDAHFVDFTTASPGPLQNFCTATYVLPYCAGFPSPVPPFANRSGERTAQAPRWSGSAGLQYAFGLPGDLRLTTAVNTYMTTRYNDQDPYVPHIPGYARFDGRLSLRREGGSWGVDLIGKNLTDRIIFSTAGGGSVSKQEPANVAIQFNYHY